MKLPKVISNIGLEFSHVLQISCFMIVVIGEAHPIIIILNGFFIYMSGQNKGEVIGRRKERICLQPLIDKTTNQLIDVDNKLKKAKNEIEILMGKFKDM